MHPVHATITRWVFVGEAPIFATVGARAEARIDWLQTAHADGRHNAFTDLIRSNDTYYLCFRHGETQMSMDGEIRVMTSTDMRT
ncbi:MAG: hypothetical protein AMXMBFR4_13590 [Candidatus Hydrogenedentota bacterium]